MKEFKYSNGCIVHMPDSIQRTYGALADGQYHCACHVRLGNDFYFLPLGSCLRQSKQCDNPKGQALDT